MTHPRDNFQFTDFFEVVADLPDRRDAHIAFLTTRELADQFLADFETAADRTGCIYTNPGVRKVYAINSLTGNNK